MGVSRAEFVRLLPAIFGGVTPPDRDGRFTFAGHGRRLEITLSDERERVLSATVRLPYLEVEFVFVGYGAADAARFLEHLDRQCQKCGG